MSLVVEKPRRATLQDFLAIPEEQRHHEIIDGELVRKAMPSPKHSRSQAAVTSSLFGPYNRRPGGPPHQPGGWWFLTEAEVLFGEEPLRPDVAGWRRERLSEIPDASPLGVIPDWICEILSPTNPTNDTIKKKRIYHHFKVPHYWILDPRDETLTVYRWGSDGYVELLMAERGERVRAAPFDAVPLAVGVFFGDDDEPAGG
jgi:Uma2 family endonuclease